MNKKGGITVEAAFIIPIILMIVFLFVYVIFAVHDRAVILMKADLMLEKATAPFLKEKNNEAEDTDTGRDTDIQDGLFIYRISQYEIIKNSFFYTVNVDARARMSIGYLVPYFNRFSYYGVHKMHRMCDYCKEKRTMSVVMEESGE